MTEARRCSHCGAELPPGTTPEGLCPSCLLKLGLESEASSAESRDSQTTVLSTDKVPSVGQAIGPYRILEVLGEGGMGIVYLAEQEKPIRRRVALKLIKLGMDTREVVSRFEAERQALALMDHPNIARVLDAGATPDGRPYFVMEYVPGLPLTDCCDRQRLSNAERLGLLIQVCAAIQHAHQKGVIHRDLKPSNVLVTVQEARPVPKVIDFGIAKATHQRLTERTLFTQQGLIVGTPEYMSPEQAEMSGLDVDTTSDIYSLGLLLYELLVGALPFDPAALRRAGYDEIRRIIREEEPPRPSARLTGLGAKATGVAARRRTDIGTLTRELLGDLDWITLKAMEKDRTRRYASASELASDIVRHLKNEPVMARPPSPTYRVRKFARRRKAAVMAASLVLSLILAAAIISSLLYLRAESARVRAETEAHRNRLELEAFSAWAEDMGQSRYELPGYLPRARKALSLQRKISDSAAFARHLLRHLTMAGLSHLLGRASKPVAQFERETVLELVNLELSLLQKDDVQALSFVALISNDLSAGDSTLDLEPAVHEQFLRESLRVGISKLKRGDPFIVNMEEILSDFLWKKGRQALKVGDAATAGHSLREAYDLHRSPS